MDDNLLHLLRQKLVDGIAMRRSGKTSLLWQELSDRLASPGMERSGLPGDLVFPASPVAAAAAREASALPVPR